jgi:hypothetical protein
MFIAIWEIQRNLNIPVQIFENWKLQSIVYETNVSVVISSVPQNAKILSSICDNVRDESKVSMCIV